MKRVLAKLTALGVGAVLGIGLAVAASAQTPKRGGVLNVVRYEIEVSCRADAMPQQIEVDLSGLEIGDSIHISAVALPDGVAPTITDRDFTIATIAAPSLRPEDEEEEEEGEEGEEGELLEGEEGEAAGEDEAAKQDSSE